MYLFYRYFWWRKPGWVKKIDYEDIDARFEEFLQACDAALLAPVLPGFEVAPQHYLDAGQVWNGQPPLEVGSDYCVSTIQEIKKRREAALTAKPIGDPWEVRLPTSLVRLHNTSELPRRTKDATGKWNPVPETGAFSGLSPAIVVAGERGDTGSGESQNG